LIAWLATPYQGIRFSGVQPGSPAAAAGLQPGDAILAVNGIQHEFQGGDSIDDLHANVGRPVVLTIARADGTLETVDVTLRSQAEIDAAPKDEDGTSTLGPLGISGPFQAAFFGTVSRDLPTAISVGANQTVYWFGVILGGLGDLVRQVANN